jgi:hypothetical protein
MAKTIYLHFRLTRQEHERIRNMALAKGFPSMAAFIRAITLERDLWLEKKIHEIYAMTKTIQENQKLNQCGSQASKEQI